MSIHIQPDTEKVIVIRGVNDDVPFRGVVSLGKDDCWYFTVIVDGDVQKLHGSIKLTNVSKVRVEYDPLSYGVEGYRGRRTNSISRNIHFTGVVDEDGRTFDLTKPWFTDRVEAADRVINNLRNADGITRSDLDAFILNAMTRAREAQVLQDLATEDWRRRVNRRGEMSKRGRIRNHRHLERIARRQERLRKQRRQYNRPKKRHRNRSKKNTAKRSKK